MIAYCRVDTVQSDPQKTVPLLKRKKRKQAKTVTASGHSILAPDSVALEASSRDGVEQLEESSERRESKAQQDGKPMMFVNLAQNDM